MAKAKPKTKATPAERLDQATLRLLAESRITLPDGTPWVAPDWMRRNLIEAPLTLKADGTPWYGLVYLEGPKGCAKTFATVMVHLCEALVHGDTLMVIAGKDRDAIQPDVDFLTWAIKRSPLLRKRCQVLTDLIRLDGGSRVEFWPADEKGTHGTGGAFARFRVLLEDPHAWAAHELMDSMLATTGKTKNTRLTICTNPGPRRSGRLWALRSQAKRQHGRTAWYWAPWSEGTPPAVPWISQAWKLQTGDLLPPGVRARYIEGLWSEDDSFVTRQQALDCVGTHGSGRAGVGRVYLGLDIGIRKDFAAVAWGMPGGGRFILHGTKVWQPRLQPWREVLLDEVETEIRGIAGGYTAATLHADPMQAYQMLQRLDAVRGGPCRIEEFPNARQADLAARFYEGITRRLLVLPADLPGLPEELCSLEVKPAGFGFRFTYTGREHGHGDQAMAVALSYYSALTSAAGLQGLRPRPDLYSAGGGRATAPASPAQRSLVWASTGCPSPWGRAEGASLFDKYDRGELEGQAGGGGRRPW